MSQTEEVHESLIVGLDDICSERRRDYPLIELCESLMEHFKSNYSDGDFHEHHDLFHEIAECFSSHYDLRTQAEQADQAESDLLIQDRNQDYKDSVL